ncbi:MAG: TatD family hydrolase [Treponema sp.]|nr:TatD family hydrolase [Treponema sp.]
MARIFCDSHVHLFHSATPVFLPDESYVCVSSCHSKEEFEAVGHYHASFGIHPQVVNSQYLKTDFQSDRDYLESLLAAKKILAIGECGFDFFTPEFKSTAREQEFVFEQQLFLAQKYQIPLVLHIRKAVEKIFSYSRELKKVPSVIFHSFPGTYREATSIQNHGIHAFFSFGKPLLNGKKSAIDCAKNLPIESLLLETDAPYQTLKGEHETKPEEIKRVYESVCELRKIKIDELSESIFKNFKKAYRCAEL